MLLRKQLLLKGIICIASLIAINSSFANHTLETGGTEDSNAIVGEEKCAGIVKTGQGDGRTVIDDDEFEWVYVPAGSCAKFTGSKIIYDED